MASASVDDMLDAEVGSYWSKDDMQSDCYDGYSSPSKELANGSKLRRTTSKMLERMSSRPWLRRRGSRKASRSSVHSVDADAVSCSGSTSSRWDDAEDLETSAADERQEDDVSMLEDNEGVWEYSQADGCPLPMSCESRTVGCTSAASGMDGLFDRSEECRSRKSKPECGSVFQDANAGDEPPTSRMRISSISTPGHANIGRVSSAFESRRWTQGSTNSLPLSLAYSSRKFSHVSAAGELPCHCPSCCSCTASGSSQTLSEKGGVRDYGLPGTFPRRKGKKPCPLRSSLESELIPRLSQPGSTTSIVTRRSLDSGSNNTHKVAARISSAPGSFLPIALSRSPSTSMGSLSTQAQFSDRRAGEFGSVQTLCEEKMLGKVDEGGPSWTSRSSYWLDGRAYKSRVETMLGWFDDFSDQQRNIFLERLLGSCNVSQMHYLSTALEPVLHQSCPHNCQDLLSWLPMSISRHILSFLDPVSLCRASQVSSCWYELATEPSLWARLARLPRWRPSELEVQRLVAQCTYPDTDIVDWKSVFSDMYRLRRNWLQGRFTIRTFAGHTSGISCVQFDDTRIVSGSSDRTIKVWDIRTNTPLCALTLVGHSATVRCLHLCGDRLVSGSADSTIKVWDLSMDASGCWSSAACRVTMIGHSHTVRCLQVDDTKIVSGSYDMTLKVWDLKSGECRNTLHGHTAAVICLQYDEERIVSGSADNTIKVWRLLDGMCLLTLEGHQDAVTCLQFDSEKIISGSVDCAIKFWSIETGQCIQTLDWIRSEGHRGVVRDLQADEWKIVSAADDKTLKVWSTESCQRLLTLRCHTDGVTCLQYNDRRIVSGSYDKTVKLYDFSAC